MLNLDKDRLENAIGWYHSHPGYGCWLSGIDVGTQKLHQQYEGKIVLQISKFVSIERLNANALFTIFASLLLIFRLI